MAQGIGRVLYPGDESDAGRALRLRQEYFFTAASIADIVARHQRDHGDLGTLPDGAAIQLNDTHPAIAVPELVRQLHDAHGMSFDAAVDTARGCISYTNHTLLPEALESWPRPLFGALLPRHMQIVERLDQRASADTGTRLVDDHGAGNVLMGNVAFFGSHRVNGVSALHTELMKQTVFSELHRSYPERIVNQTNGVTPRRWLAGCNPGLASLLDDAIGGRWVTDLEQLRALEPLSEDAGFRDGYANAKLHNKQALAREVKRRTGISVSADAMFDVQVKRLHEYKRQLLNILETVAYYRALKAGTAPDGPPRVRLFAGKAAPSYHVAKRIIKLINDVAVVVNADPATNDRLRVAFLPDYNVSLAEVIMPAADLSEQISTAGMEASGTGNMKLGLNGALTIGTLDGANVEMAEQVGRDNIFIFGLEAGEVRARRESGRDARTNVEASDSLSDVFAVLRSGEFSGGDKGRYDDILGGIEHGDYFMVSDDFDAYAATQREVDAVYADRDEWLRRAVLNTARLGWFSSDRTIASYARDIWGVTPAPALDAYAPSAAGR